MCFFVLISENFMNKVTMEQASVKEEAALRCMKSELGLLSKSDGSSNFNQGDTSALASVYGPSEVRLSKEYVEKATVEVFFKRKSGRSSCADRLCERILRNICETVVMSTLHPRSLISVTLQEVHDGGSFMACCANAMCLALLDSAVSMKYLAAGVCSVINSDGSIVVDPTKKQEEQALASFTFVFDSVNHHVLSVSTRGLYTNEQFQASLLVCRDASKLVFQYFRESTEKKLTKALI